MPTDITIGARVRFHRVGRGLTQQQLAVRAGISVPLVQSIEEGRRVPTGHVLNLLARELGVPLEGLLGQTRAAADGHPAVRPIRDAILGLGDPSPATDLDTMRDRVESLGDTWFGKASYDRTGALLPDLIREADALRRAFATPQEERERRQAARLAFQVHFVASHFGSAVGAADVAIATRERMVQAADASDDPAAIAASRWLVGLKLVKEGHLDASEAILRRQIEELERWDDDLTNRSLLGMMNAAASVMAVRQGNLDRAHQYVDEAQRIAASTGENSIHWSCWGPTNVGIYIIEIEAEHGNAHDGIRAAERIDPSALEMLPAVERRFHYLTCVAWLYHQLDQDPGTILYLKHAQQVAPDECRYSRLVHQLVGRPLERTPATHRTDVMELAQQIGMLA